MTSHWQTFFDLLGQFTGGRGGVDHNIVQFVLAAVMWSVLVVLAFMRHRNSNHPDEELMVIGFSFGLLRELIMLFMALLQSFKVVPLHYLHVIFPPLEHAVFDIAIVIVAASFMRYLLQDKSLSRRFLQIGVTMVCLCYLATFWWWANAIIQNPQITFGKTWCDWLFRVNASLLIIYPILVLLHLTRGWVRNAVCLGLTCFFLNQFLKIPDLILFEVHENIFAPIRHGFYLLGIPLIGYVYVRELYTEHLLTEQKLQVSENRYRRLFEESLDTLYVSSKDGYFLDLNPAGLELFGLTKQDIEHTQISDIYVDRESRRHFQNEIRQNGSVHGYEVELRKKDGRKMSCLLTASIRFDHSGRNIGYQGIIRDVTLQKEIEGQLRQSEKMEAMGTLAGGIAHDFNNILTAIIGYAFIAKRALPDDSPANKAISEIHSAGNRAKDLVRQILAFSRRDEQVKKPLHLQVIIKEALKLLRATVPTTIEFDYDFADHLYPVLAEPTQILQLLLNLCTNAVHAMPDKGRLEISINVSDLTRQDSVLPACFSEGRFVHLKVSDTGHGISPDILSRIYDPFFTTKGVGEGTGMGLSVVHGIVKAHGGFITVDSVVEKGTSFSVYFPAIRKSDKDQDILPERSYYGTERILFVDDEQTIVNLAQITLTAFGYKVTSSTNSTDALAMIKAQPKAFDLVITDQNMPHLSGAELAKKILEFDPQMPIILCSGYSTVFDEKQAEELGIKAFILKPLVEHKLAAAVRSVLDTS